VRKCELGLIQFAWSNFEHAQSCYQVNIHCPWCHYHSCEPSINSWCQLTCYLLPLQYSFTVYPCIKPPSWHLNSV